MNNTKLITEVNLPVRTTELVDGFRHSAPYVNAHRGKTFVVMLGGEALAHPQFRGILNDVALLHSLGIEVVLVYGARPQIDAGLRNSSPRTTGADLASESKSGEWILLS